MAELDIVTKIENSCKELGLLAEVSKMYKKVTSRFMEIKQEMEVTPLVERLKNKTLLIEIVSKLGVLHRDSLAEFNTIDESYAEINQGERYITIKNSIETLLEEIHTLTKLYIKALCQVGFLEAFNTATTELAAGKLKITNDCPQ